MKIAIVGSAYPLRGGIASFVERLAEEGMKEKHDVTIYSYSLQYPSILFPGKTQISSDPPPLHLKIKTLINTLNPFNWWKVGTLIKKELPDMILVKYWMSFFSPALGTILRIVKKNNHTKIICIADNIIPHENRLGDKILNKYFIKAVDGIVTMSKEVLGDLKKITTKPAIFTPHPLYDNYGSIVTKEAACQFLKINATEKYILFFGFIRKYKGLDLLLHALNREEIRTEKIKLIIAGEYYGNEEEYKKIINELNIADSILAYTSFIPNTELHYYFCAADLIVLPYKSATQSGITQIAWQYEKPVIATNVGGLPEVVKNNITGYLCEPNPQSIAHEILKFYQPSNPINFTENIRLEKKNYTWETFTKRILEFYQKISLP